MALMRLSTWVAKTSERNTAVVIASIASISVASVFVWTTFFNAPAGKEVVSINTAIDSNTKVVSKTTAVFTTEKPNLSQPHKIQPDNPHLQKNKNTPSKATLSPKHQLQKNQTVTKQAVHKPIIHHKKPPATQKTQLTIGKGKLFVQTGAFKEIANARVSYEKMRETYKRAKIIPKKGYYAIWVGPVSTRDEAEILQKHILSHDKIKGFITSK